MAINIQSLFSDIIETPAQRQERMLTEGILRGRELTSGLTGLARTQAPLVSALSMQMPQRQEALRRGVGGMLGLDVRTESEKLQDILRQADTSTPTGMINLSRAIQSIAPSQAATLRQMAVEQQREMSEAERQRKRQEAADARAERQLELSELREERLAETEQRQSEQADRNRQIFENQMTVFEQSQEERDQEISAANAIRNNLINTLPQDSPYLDALKNESAYIPLSNLRQIYNDYQSGLDRNVTIRTIFDPDSGKNMIVSIDSDTGDIVNTIAEAERSTPEKTVPNLTEDRKKTIEDILDDDEDLADADLFGIIGSKDLAIDLVHNYSEKNNTSLADTINVIKNQIVTEEGRNLLRIGMLNVDTGEFEIVE